MLNFTNETYNVAGNAVSEDYLSYCVTYHETHPAFQRRPINTGLIRALENTGLWTTGTAFITINFLLLLLCGMLIFWISRKLFSAIKPAYWSVVGFYFSFTILFAFFPKIYSYDEPLQYALLLASVLAMLQRRPLLFVLSFSLSLVARESGLLLLPALAYWWLKQPSSMVSSLRNRWLFLTLPVVLYGVYLLIFLQFKELTEASGETFMSRSGLLAFNFQNMAFARESIASFVLALGVPAYLVWSHRDPDSTAPNAHVWLRAFLIAIALNTPVIYLTARAQEARLFALPLLFLWPIAGAYLLHAFDLFRPHILWKQIQKRWWLLGPFVLFNLVNAYVYWSVTIPTGFYKTDNFQDEYLFLCLLFLSLHLLARALGSQSLRFQKF